MHCAIATPVTWLGSGSCQPVLWGWILMNEWIYASPCFRNSACSWKDIFFNPLQAELNPVCHLLTLLGAHHILHVSRIRVKLFTCAMNLSSKAISFNFCWTASACCSLRLGTDEMSASLSRRLLFLPVMTPSCRRMGFDTRAAAAPECLTIMTLPHVVALKSDCKSLLHCYSAKSLWRRLSLVCAGNCAASIFNNLPLRWRVAQFTGMFSAFHSGCYPSIHLLGLTPCCIVCLFRPLVALCPFEALKSHFPSVSLITYTISMDMIDRNSWNLRM